jgi:hypothetical protein
VSKPTGSGLEDNQYVRTLNDFGIYIPDALLNTYFELENQHAYTQYEVSYKTFVL